MKNLFKALMVAPVAVSMAAGAQAADMSTLDKADAVATQAAAAGQVTSISQLSDVKPTDWAFQALQSLVERYGCIVGYPNKTYQGNKALSRYEFAAGLNACIDKVTEYAASKEDLETLKRLMQEFQAELATLKGRVDALDAKVAELQAQQFSTTTKLAGSVIMSLDQAYNPMGTNTGVSFGTLTDLDFNTSFTGKDLLKTRIRQSNIWSPATRGMAQSGNVAYPGAALDYDYLNLLPGESVAAGSPFYLDKLYYKFPVNNVTFTVGTSDLQVEDIFSQTGTFYTPVFNYFFGAGIPGIYGDGNAPNVGGAGFNWQLSKNFNFGVAYIAQSAAVDGSASTAGQDSGGLFGLGNQLTTQINWQSDSGNFVGSLVYAYRKGQNIGSQGNFGGVSYGTFRALLGPDATAGCTVASATTAQTCPSAVVTSNNLGITLGYAFNPNFTLSGAFSYGWLGSGSGQTSQVASWMVGATFPNLFAKGNQANLAIGQIPWVTSSSNAGNADSGNFALEAGYKFQVTDNISITPGIYFITNPGGGLGPSGTMTVPVLRTQFVF
jgi:hypothetical protein